MKAAAILLFLLPLYMCSPGGPVPAGGTPPDSVPEADTLRRDTAALPSRKPAAVVIEKELLYDRYTLDDRYPYKDTVREFQWGKIRGRLALVDSLRAIPAQWGTLQNYKNLNGEAPLVRNYRRDAYTRISDTLGVERYQSVPLYLPADTTAPERYGRDGALVRLAGEEGSFVRISTAGEPGEWLVPRRYVGSLADTALFDRAVFIDRTNQNIATLEKSGGKWLVRSMNPATTGLHNPPYAQETPLGLFVLQERKERMVFLKDGSAETGGFAPYASRFSCGGYIHGVPVNAPRTALIEYSPSLGTTPRSHMCVRNATSHARFVYQWGISGQTLVFVLE